MTQEERDQIKKTIGELFNLRDKYFDFQINTKFQLGLAQLDLFKTLSTIVIALLGIGYVFDAKFNKDFLFISTAFILIVLFGTISFIRESIDSEDKSLEDNEILIKEKTEETIRKSVEALEKDDFNIYFDFVKQKATEFHPQKEDLLYTGEIFNFLLYLSIFFLTLSYLSPKFDFSIWSIQTATAIVLAYVLSHTEWSTKMIRIFSKKFRISK